MKTRLTREINPAINTYMNLWTQLEKQQIREKGQIEKYLIKKLGHPATETHTNLLGELTRKITAYYCRTEPENYSTYSLVGACQEIQAKKYKEGKHKGQTYYVLQLKDGQSVQARKEDLADEKWQQITSLALLNKNLVFQYKKYFTNKQIIDFYAPNKKHHV